MSFPSRPVGPLERFAIEAETYALEDELRALADVIPFLRLSASYDKDSRVEENLRHLYARLINARAFPLPHTEDVAP